MPPALEYDSIIKESTQAVNNRAGDVSQIETTAKTRLRVVLARANSTPLDDFTPHDYVALCECAIKTKDWESLSRYEEKAISLATDIKPYIVVTQARCSMACMKDVESIIAQATKRFADSEQLYLLHNMAAIKYRSMKELEHARVHFFKTTDLLVSHIGSDVFYTSHLARCLKDLDSVSFNDDRGRLSSQLDEWRSAVARQYEVANGKSDRTAFQTLESACLYGPALVSLNSYLENDEGEMVLVKWGYLLASAIRDLEITDELLHEANVFAVESMRAPGPSWKCDELAAALDGVIRRLDEKDDRTDPELLKVRHSLASALQCVLQHRKHLRLIGNRVIDQETLQSLNPNNSEFVLVHLTSPTAPNAREALRSVVLHRDVTARNSLIAVGIMSPYSKATHGTSLGRSAEQQQSYLDRFSSELNLPVKCLLLRPEQADKLDAKVLPVNILLDRSGNVVCALTGSSSQSVEKVIRLARSKGMAE